jgi:predicted transposase YbfD/YdcC
MDAESPRGVTRFFDDIEDPRIDRTKRHNLQDILTIALVAILGGAEAWTQVEMFARAKREWFARFLELPHGIPSHDTFGRLFARIDPEQLGKCFDRWVRHLATRFKLSVKTIALDGKTLRGSADAAGGEPALHLLSAWAHEARLVLAQLAVDSKSNEITAIPELIARLELGGCVVTVDALNTQKSVAQAILDRGGDYVMALKGNQGTLHDDAALMLAEAEDAPRSARFVLDDHTTEDDAHGRIERRRYSTLAIDKRTWRIKGDRWPGLKAIGRVVRERTDKTTGKIATQTVYYLMSKPMDVRRFADAVRGHWGIENAAHWVLDVTFNEDRCRCRKDHSDVNFALLRRLAMNLLRHNRDRSKLSMKAQRLNIGWDTDFLEDLLRHLV